MLNKNSKRIATIKCLTDCYLGVVNKETYEKTIGKIQKGQVEELYAFLRRLPLFHKWSRNNL